MPRWRYFVKLVRSAAARDVVEEKGAPGPRPRHLSPEKVGIIQWRSMTHRERGLPSLGGCVTRPIISIGATVAASGR
jgi:hypothetical protein